MRESAIEKYLKNEVVKHQGLCWKFNSMGTAGVPDRIVIFKNKILMVELKNEHGRASRIQMYRKQQLEDLGVSVIYINSKQEVDNFIRETCHE